MAPKRKATAPEAEARAAEPKKKKKVGAPGSLEKAAETAIDDTRGGRQGSIAAMFGKRNIEVGLPSERRKSDMVADLKK